MKIPGTTLMVVIGYAIAMGFLEAVVVVYLREIYFPEGFSFPMVLIQPQIFAVELVREITTMVMLAAVGMLAGSTNQSRFAWFLVAFGVWDISYYGGLKIFLNWPGSVFTWDILFLIPVAWVGPVLAPLICSLTMITLGFFAISIEQQQGKVRFGRLNWILLLTGSCVIITSFVQDFLSLHLRRNAASIPDIFSWKEMIETTSVVMPERFSWWLFIVGELLILFAIFNLVRRNTSHPVNGIIRR